jgi:hypothetical protein
MTFDRLFGQVTDAAAANGLTIYDICFRRAGVAIMWCDNEKLLKVGDANYKHSLFVDHFYPTLRKAVEGELKRLKKQHQSVEQ